MILSDRSIREELERGGSSSSRSTTTASSRPRSTCTSTATSGSSATTASGSSTSRRTRRSSPSSSRSSRTTALHPPPGRVRARVDARAGRASRTTSSAGSRASRALGRLGLLIHSTAGFVDAGWDGHLTLELSNVANLPITRLSRDEDRPDQLPAHDDAGRPSLRVERDSARSTRASAARRRAAIRELPRRRSDRGWFGPRSGPPERCGRPSSRSTRWCTSHPTSRPRSRTSASTASGGATSRPAPRRWGRFVPRS